MIFERSVNGHGDGKDRFFLDSGCIVIFSCFGQAKEERGEGKKEKGGIEREEGEGKRKKGGREEERIKGEEERAHGR